MVGYVHPRNVVPVCPMIGLAHFFLIGVDLSIKASAHVGHGRCPAASFRHCGRCHFTGERRSDARAQPPDRRYGSAGAEHAANLWDGTSRCGIVVEVTSHLPGLSETADFRRVSHIKKK
jgi:hypothetical protein